MKRQVFICLLVAMVCGCAHRPVSPAQPAVPEAKGPPAVSSRVNHWTAEWTPLFNGRNLENWAVTDFGGHGPVTVENGEIHIGAGDELSGITWTNGTLPKTGYEISLETEKVQGGDFFCGLTFPVAESSCSLILGGWGGGVIGLSSLDDEDASENETTKYMNFPANRWYAVKLRVTPARIQAWIDADKVVDVLLDGKKVSLRPGSIFMSAPLGIATYETSSAIRNFQIRLIEH